MRLPSDLGGQSPSTNTLANGGAQTRAGQVAENSGGLLDHLNNRRYVTLRQHLNASWRVRQDRRRLVSRRRIVHSKRHLERRAHRCFGVERAVVRRGRRRNPVRRRRSGGQRRQRWAKPQSQRPVGVQGQLIGTKLCRSELSDGLDHPVLERACTGGR